MSVANTDPRARSASGGRSRLADSSRCTPRCSRPARCSCGTRGSCPTAQAKLWNPTTNIFTDVPVGAGLFCAGQATDANGNVIVVGGHDGGQVGIKDVYSFNPDTRSWTSKPDMHSRRWYPSVTQMPDGRMLTLSGMKTPYVFANTPEIYDPATGKVTTVPITTPELHEEQYPQTAVLPNGKVLAISAEHGGVMTFDPATNAWTKLGTTQVPFGAWTSFAPGQVPGHRRLGHARHLRPEQPGAVDEGGQGPRHDQWVPVWSHVPDMATARSFHNVTMLPTGDALVLGGSTAVNDFAPQEP